MTPEYEVPGATPPHKKRRTDESSPEPDRHTKPKPNKEFYASSRASSRSRSASGHSSSSLNRRSPSGLRSRSVSQSGSLRSRSRSASRSSTNRTRTESFSPRPRRATPLPEPRKPNYQPKLVLRGHTKPVSQVRISPNGRYIASASADSTLRIWDAATGDHMDTLIGHLAGVSCLAWGPDSNTLASGSDDKAIHLWDRVTGRPQTTTRKSAAGQERAPLRGHHNYIHCLAFSPKGNILASGSYDEAVFLWDVRAGRLMRSLPAHSDPVSGIDFCRDGTLVVSCSTDGLIRVWDTSTGQCLRTLVHEDNPAVTNVCFSPNGRFVLAFNLDNCIRLWDYVSGSVKKTYQGHRNEKFAIGGCFAVLDGEPLVASASEDGAVVLWNVKSKEVMQRVQAHNEVCFWVDVHGEVMVTAGQDGTVRIFRHSAISTPDDASEKPAVVEELPIRQDVKMGGT
ncbi:WD40-repeat-containing domain protein [Stachybotrys elegans]|uniref:Mitochondrial division protein 1 n=1 Tax=Stachybotrys elegans TaxID=80388 RepID=A0A8K0WWP9_9HYPO|nr:WD40-repeat-containing domain protein [Stachybotrys elegans]